MTWPEKSEIPIYPTGDEGTPRALHKRDAIPKRFHSTRRREINRLSRFVRCSGVTQRTRGLDRSLARNDYSADIIIRRFRNSFHLLFRRYIFFSTVSVAHFRLESQPLQVVLIYTSYSLHRMITRNALKTFFNLRSTRAHVIKLCYRIHVIDHLSRFQCLLKFNLVSFSKKFSVHIIIYDMKTR